MISLLVFLWIQFVHFFASFLYLQGVCWLPSTTDRRKADIRVILNTTNRYSIYSRFLIWSHNNPCFLFPKLNRLGHLMVEWSYFSAFHFTTNWKIDENRLWKSCFDVHWSKDLLSRFKLKWMTLFGDLWIHLKVHFWIMF